MLQLVYFSRRLLRPLIYGFLLSVPTISADAADYYVDATTGHDGNSGLAPDLAWQTLDRVNGFTFQPGDAVLFKANCTWTGQLHPGGSGSPQNMITIDMYGSGNMPRIDCNGVVTDVVHFYNQSYWEIRHLEITNDDNFGSNHTSAFRRGIHIQADNIGACRHMHIIDCYVHDIDGNENDKDNGGIACRITADTGTGTPTRFENIRIEGCCIRKVDATGIFTRSQWDDRLDSSGNLDWYGSTNVVIRNNSLEDIGKDGITVRACSSPLIEGNVLNGGNMRSNGSAAGMWPFNCDDALFQYNEVYNMRGTWDGQGFDCDWRCYRTVFQYNYSHDNEGGFMLIMGSHNENYDPVIRYNISVNDRSRIFQFVGGRPSNVRIYNNTVYIPPGYDTRIVDSHDTSPAGGNWEFYNNIIYNLGTGGYDYNAEAVYDYNCFYGNHPAGEPYDPHKLTADPKLIDPGSGGIGIDTLDGYQLLSDSPCVDSGMVIANNGGQDFWWTSLYIGSPDRGVHEYGYRPEPPGNVTLSMEPDGSIHVSWQDESGDEDGFEIQRKPYLRDNTAWHTVAQVGPNITSYVDSDHIYGVVTYTYRVGAVKN